MARLSKRLIANHNQALEVLKKDILSDEDKRFVFENYNEGAFRDNAYFGAFFTPQGMADYLAFDTFGSIGNNGPYEVIELCAGIGAIAYSVLDRYGKNAINMTCIEINPEYLKIGKKLVPEANWILADVLDLDLILSLGKFDFAIMNPPFGRIRSLTGKSINYSGPNAEFKVLDVACHIADFIGAIVPQTSAGYKYSGEYSGTRYLESKELNRFTDELKVEIGGTMGHDLTDEYAGKFKNVSIPVEIITIDASHIKFKPQLKQATLF